MAKRGAAKDVAAKSYPLLEPAEPLRVQEPEAHYGVSSRKPFNIAVDASFKISAVESLAARLNIPVDDLMALLGIGTRTAQRRWQEGELAADESDRLYRVARLAHRAIEVLGSQEGANSWLKRPQAIFEGAAPLSLLGSDAGAKAVEDQLGRIDYGIFA